MCSLSSGHNKWIAVSLIICLALMTSHEVSGQYLSPEVIRAAEAARLGSASRGQRALLFKHNDAINKARLSGWLPDSTYQAAQREYSSLNQEFARMAAESTGAEFTVQQSTSTTYSPGTDSDYIVKTNGADPVGQVQTMQSRYNDHVNSYLDEALSSEGYHHTPKDNWHNSLDVDFMADPANVTDEQFRQIAELNNDAYTRRGSAEFERRSRMGGVEVTPEQFTDYANEMQDFIDKKQGYLNDIQNEIKKNPRALSDPKTLARQHRLMAQEQKYISRIEAADELLRKQEGLPPRPKPKGPPIYDIIEDGKGNAVIRKRPTGTVAQMGSKRSPSNRPATVVGSSLAENSIQRAVTDLSESMTDAAAKNPSKWPNSQAQIAEFADRMPPSAKGQLLERVAARREASALQQILRESGDLDDAGMAAARAQARRVGNEYSRGVAQEMQARVRASRPSLAAQADSRLRGMLGVTDDAGDIARLRGLRGTVNRGAASLMSGMERVGTLGTVAEVYGALNTSYSIFSNVSRARDPNTSAAEARELYQQARNDMARLGTQGLLAGVSYASPTVGAMIGGYEMGYAAGRVFLDNTAIGQSIDQAALTAFDSTMILGENVSDWFTEYLGGQSQRTLDEERLRQIESSYWNALREGRIRMRPGVRTTDIAEMIRSGNLAGVRDLIEPGPNAPKPDPSKVADTKKKPRHPNDDLEWINQTFEPESDTKIRDEYHDLVAKGTPPIGPAPGETKKPRKPKDPVRVRLQPNYRAQAEAIVRNSGRSPSASSSPDYRTQAERVNARVVAAEAERARQARIAEARRQEALRQEALRQEAQRQEARRQQAIAAERYRQQQIYNAQRARQQQIYNAQRAAYARQQQQARQQAWINGIYAAQQALQQYQQSQQYYSQPRQQYWPRNSGGGGGSYNGSEYDYYNSSENPIRW